MVRRIERRGHPWAIDMSGSNRLGHARIVGAQLNVEHSALVREILFNCIELCVLRSIKVETLMEQCVQFGSRINRLGQHRATDTDAKHCGDQRYQGNESNATCRHPRPFCTRGICDAGGTNGTNDADGPTGVGKLPAMPIIKAATAAVVSIKRPCRRSRLARIASRTPSMPDKSGMGSAFSRSR
jgi:hypothetical protein